jgi:histidinol dehydrogenase
MLLKRLRELSEEDKKKLLSREVELEAVYPVVEEIIREVKARGDEALREYTRRYDGVAVEDFRVSEEEFAEARKNKKLMKALKEAYRNIRFFHERQLREAWSLERGGAVLGQVYRAVKRVGCYIPGGRAAYPSTVLMTVIPAQVAGVKEIACITPPGKDGRANSSVLLACDVLGVREVYKVGGAQGIAALAYGTESMTRVDKIVGPGNVYVTAAKLLVSGRVAIDFPAGPSEVLIIADETADPEFVALDMLAQAEHDPAARSLLVTTSEQLGREVAGRVKKENLETEGMAVLTANSLKEAIAFANSYAPEHLEILTSDPEAVLEEIQNAGSVFLGNYTPVALGDYASGTNHVLPTQGWARVYSGLGVKDFLKEISVQRFDRAALAKIADVVITLAEEEGLRYHAESVRRRLKR